MAVPKKKVSKLKKSKKLLHKKVHLVNFITCKNCKSRTKMHSICKVCNT